MANDERRSETFIREVDEELRRDQLKQLWKRFAPLIIGVCVLIVAITAGYRGFVWWEERKAAQAGDRFMAALAKIESGSREEGEAELVAIASDSDIGYAALARLRLAGEKAGNGAKPEALAAYDAVANDNAVPQPLRDLALIRAALLALDTGDVAGAKERATRLNTADNPWRHAAREVIGTAAYQAGELQAARDAFTEIQQDAQTPADLWVRSGLMVSLIDGQLAAPAAVSSEAEPGAPAETEAAAEATEAPAATGTNPEPASVPSAPESTPAPPLTPTSAPSPVPTPAPQPMPVQPTPATPPTPAPPASTEPGALSPVTPTP